MTLSVMSRKGFDSLKTNHCAHIAQLTVIPTRASDRRLPVRYPCEQGGGDFQLIRYAK
jgi:hypothetical protein